MNSSIAGVVMISGICDDIDLYTSIATGILASLVYLYSSKFLYKLKIDDPVDSIAVHGFCGLFGTIIVGLLGKTEGIFKDSNYMAL
jgi:Amt family ammonium transporter